MRRYSPDAYGAFEGLHLCVQHPDIFEFAQGWHPDSVADVVHDALMRFPSFTSAFRPSMRGSERVLCAGMRIAYLAALSVIFAGSTSVW